MSKKHVPSLIFILRRLGVRVDRSLEERVEAERQLHPDQTTADILTRISDIPPPIIDRAIEAAKERGDHEYFIEQLAEARRRVAETRGAAETVTALAEAIAGRK